MCQCIDYLENDYLISEFCNCGSLKELQEEKSYKLQRPAIAKIMYKLVQGVKDIAKAGMTHMDLKPANVMLHLPNRSEELSEYSEYEKKKFIKNLDLTAVDFQIKIIDLGLAAEESYLKGKIGTELTMAPQVFKKMEYTNKADVWSIGMTMSLLLDGV